LWKLHWALALRKAGCSSTCSRRLLLVLLLGPLMPLDPCAHAARCCLFCCWRCAGASITEKIEEIQEKKRAKEVSEMAILLLKRVFCRGSIYTKLALYASLVRGGAACVFAGVALEQLHWAMALRKAGCSSTCSRRLLLVLLLGPLVLLDPCAHAVRCCLCCF
jgi:hypothetical protein